MFTLSVLFVSQIINKTTLIYVTYLKTYFIQLKCQIKLRGVVKGTLRLMIKDHHLKTDFHILEVKLKMVTSSLMKNICDNMPNKIINRNIL